MTTPIYRLLPILGIWWELSALALASPYDEYMTCGSSNDRFGRQYHNHYYDVPCDLSKDAFCLTPGSQYPWSAVRRFVHENQGLIKRMYGNQRHYNVLRSELLQDMYEEMFNEMPKRQIHRFQPATVSTARTGRYHKHSNANLLQEERTKAKNRSRSIKTISMEPEYQSKSAMESSAEIPSKLRNHQTPGNRLKDIDDFDQLAMDILESEADVPSGRRTTNANVEVPHTTQTSSVSTDPTVFPPTGETTTGKDNDWFTEEELADEATTPNNALPSRGKNGEGEKMRPTYLPVPDDDLFDSQDYEFWTTLGDEYFDTFSTTTYSPEIDEFLMSTLPEEISTQNPGIYDPSEIDFDPSEENDHQPNFGSTTSSDMDGFTSLPDQLPDKAAESQTELHGRVNDKKLTGLESTGQERAALNSKDPVDFDDSDIEKREDLPLTNSLNDNALPDEMRNEDNAAATKPDRHKTPIRGVNACPVEEKILAPYWANNTRGETLALLNLYPFEQYIQWEECKYENRQMYCREGCRCEQQFRLHKLLAFDPSNECKGIFSDWFRFPSCCVCKCYDLPEELMMASPGKSGRKLDQDDLQQNDDYDQEDDDDMYGSYSTLADLNAEEEEADKENDENSREKIRRNDSDYDDDAPIHHQRRTSKQTRPQTYRVRSGSRMVNIPPQRRPRLPPRPSSHITSPRATSRPQPKSFSQQHESTTLGTLDVATPHYYYNFSHYSHMFANVHPFPLSRIPRSNPEV